MKGDKGKSNKRKKKKKNKRSRTKHPGLDKSLHLKVRQELIDFDYINQLSPEEKDWLNKFAEEYIGAKLDSKNLENNLHNTKELKKDCYDRNNARNRDIHSVTKANDMLKEYGHLGEVYDEKTTNSSVHEIEDILIELIDKKNELKD